MKRILAAGLILLLGLAPCGQATASEKPDGASNQAPKSLSRTNTKEVSGLPYDGIYPQHEPYGTGIGAVPGRVVWAYDPDSVDWDGNGFWWELDHFDEATILNMVNESITALGGKEHAKEGWAALFAANNSARGRNGGYTVGEKIAIKANINGSAVYDDNTSGKTKMSYTNPVLLKALLTSLVECSCTVKKRTIENKS